MPSSPPPVVNVALSRTKVRQSGSTQALLVVPWLLAGAVAISQQVWTAFHTSSPGARWAPTAQPEARLARAPIRHRAAKLLAESAEATTSSFGASCAAVATASLAATALVGRRSGGGRVSRRVRGGEASDASWKFDLRSITSMFEGAPQPVPAEQKKVVPPAPKAPPAPKQTYRDLAGDAAFEAPYRQGGLAGSSADGDLLPGWMTTSLAEVLPAMPPSAAGGSAVSPVDDLKLDLQRGFQSGLAALSDGLAGFSNKWQEQQVSMIRGAAGAAQEQQERLAAAARAVNDGAAGTAEAIQTARERAARAAEEKQAEIQRTRELIAKAAEEKRAEIERTRELMARVPSLMAADLESKQRALQRTAQAVSDTPNATKRKLEEVQTATKNLAALPQNMLATVDRRTQGVRALAEEIQQFPARASKAAEDAGNFPRSVLKQMEDNQRQAEKTFKNLVDLPTNFGNYLGAHVQNAQRTAESARNTAEGIAELARKTGEGLAALPIVVAGVAQEVERLPKKVEEARRTVQNVVEFPGNLSRSASARIENVDRMRRSFSDFPGRVSGSAARVAAIPDEVQKAQQHTAQLAMNTVELPSRVAGTFQRQVSGFMDSVGVIWSIPQRVQTGVTNVQRFPGHVERTVKSAQETQERVSHGINGGWQMMTAFAEAAGQAGSAVGAQWERHLAHQKAEASKKARSDFMGEVRKASHHGKAEVVVGTNRNI